MTRTAQTCALLVALFLGLGFAAEARTPDRFAGFSQPELDQMLAPIALYPDTVLSHVLIAATYPIEVVQAARWTRQNPDLRGERAVDAVTGQDWDPSVMALVAFPELLGRMDADLDWTQRLGDAFLIQEGEVLDSIQRLRAQAYQAGHLKSSEQVRVIREREVIYIEPPRRQVVYVPVYDTRVVYGSWAWAHYPPVFWVPPPRHRHRVAVYWGPAFHVPTAFFFSSFHWSQRHVVVVHHHHHYYRPHHRRGSTVVHHHHYYQGRDLTRHDHAQRWQHDPGHRRGVAYHPAVDERHRQLEQRPAVGSGLAPQAPVRIADTRSSQREWAAARRAEPILPSSGRAPDRSARAVAERSTRTPATAVQGSAQRPVASATRPSAAQRSPRNVASEPQRSAPAAVPRGSPAPSRSVDSRSSARPTADAPPARPSAAPRDTVSRPAASAPAARSVPQRSADRTRGQLSQAPRATAPSASTRAPAQQAGRSQGARLPQSRPASPPASAQRAVPQRPATSSSTPPSRPASSARPAPQRQTAPMTSPRGEPRAQSDRRAARRVD